MTRNGCSGAPPRRPRPTPTRRTRRPTRLALTLPHNREARQSRRPQRRRGRARRPRKHLWPPSAERAERSAAHRVRPIQSFAPARGLRLLFSAARRRRGRGRRERRGVRRGGGEQAGSRKGVEEQGRAHGASPNEQGPSTLRRAGAGGARALLVLLTGQMRELRADSCLHQTQGSAT